VTSDEAKKTKLPVGIAIGGGFVLLGLLGLACALASSVSQPPPTIGHLMFLILSSTCIMAGMQVCAASYIADRNEVKVEQLMTQVEACNYVLRQLSAAPTVRLHEVNQALERISREGIREIVEHVDKAVERGVQDGAVLAAREVAAVQRAAADGVVDIEDVRLLKRLEERVRRSGQEGPPEH
jgi:hypothetical protein